ncbi:unnamed protein product [Cuscuta epithymum]|uniref:Uncharacterized protein n=1 Tax=Cuscuta epithymum TaxID=186058 RepID=A0AAV0G4Y4_9ASTE|nr:unnamed protein product [Cuscuta epithymum]
MATNVLCITIGPSAPSCPTVRLAHSLQDGDDRLMQHDRLLSAIVSLSRSDRPIPSRTATNVLCSAIGPSAPSHLASRFGPPIPSRMATTVLCSTIGFSVPSCLFHVPIAHSLQDGDDRLMQCDRPLSAIVLGFTVRLAHSLQDGDERLICSTISAPVPSCLAHVRVAYPFQDGDERLLCSTISAPAPSCLAHVRVAHPFQDGDERLFMQHDQRPSAIVSGSR